MQNYVFLFKYKYDLKNFILCYIIRLKSMILIATNTTDMPSSQNGFVWDKVSMSSERMVIRAFAYE